MKPLPAPISFLMLSIASGLARSPTRLRTISPGSDLSRKKAKRVIPSRRGIKRMSLLRI